MAPECIVWMRRCPPVCRGCGALPSQSWWWWRWCHPVWHGSCHCRDARPQHGLSGGYGPQCMGECLAEGLCLYSDKPSKTQYSFAINLLEGISTYTSWLYRISSGQKSQIPSEKSIVVLWWSGRTGSSDKEGWDLSYYLTNYLTIIWNLPKSLCENNINQILKVDQSENRIKAKKSKPALVGSSKGILFNWYYLSLGLHKGNQTAPEKFIPGA